MKKHLLSALFIITLLATTGCNRYYYRPNGINDPLFTKGGQVHVGFGGSIGSGDKNEDDRMYQADLQLGFSPINHLGIVGSYSTYSYHPYNKTAEPAHAHIAEGGIGGYNAFGKKKVKMIVDLYAGGGGGSLESDVNLKLTKLYIQPGIGMRSNSFDAVINLRFSNIQYSDLNPKSHDYTYLLDHRLIDTFNNRRIDHGSYTFYEPGVTLRMGYKFVKVQLQAAWALPISAVPWHYNGGHYTIGLHFNLEDILDMANDRSSERGASKED